MPPRTPTTQRPHTDGRPLAGPSWTASGRLHLCKLPPGLCGVGSSTGKAPEILSRRAAGSIFGLFLARGASAVPAGGFAAVGGPTALGRGTPAHPPSRPGGEWEAQMSVTKTSSKTGGSGRDNGVDRLGALHEQITAGVAALVLTDRWRQMLQAAAKFYTYSLGNVLLIALQAPQATRVAGFRTWQGLAGKSARVSAASRSSRHAAPAPRRPRPARPARTAPVSSYRPSAGERRHRRPAAGSCGVSGWCTCSPWTKPKATRCLTSPRCC